MANKKVAWNPTTRVATVLLAATALPGGSQLAGTYTHPDPTDELSRSEYSHVTYQHVQDALYRAFGWQDMQRVSIVDNTIVVATGLTVAPTSLLLGVGTMGQLTPTIAPAEADERRVNYTVDNSLVAEVDKNGKVLATGVGKTMVHVSTRDGSLKVASIPVEVVATLVSVESITLAPATVSIAVAATQQLTPTVLPADATEKGVNWTTSDATKATISSTGLVTGVAVGTATITATAKDGSGKTGTRLVTVTA